MSPKKLSTYGGPSRKHQAKVGGSHPLSPAPTSRPRQTAKVPFSLDGNGTSQTSTSKDGGGLSSHSDARIRKRDHTTAFATDSTHDARRKPDTSRDAGPTSSKQTSRDTGPTSSKQTRDTLPTSSKQISKDTRPTSSAKRTTSPPKITNHTAPKTDVTAPKTKDTAPKTNHTPTTNHTASSATLSPALPLKRETTTRRPRLIDALAAQKDTLGGNDELEPRWPLSAAMSPSHTPMSRDSPVRTPDRRGTTPANRKVRFTYSQSRRIMGESQGGSETFDSPGRSAIEDELDAAATLPESQPVSPPPVDPFANDDESDEEDSSQPAIKSVHELRRAGANNRFADEMDDLLSRIGGPAPGPANPSTMRRNALCELVQKLQRKDFMRQFRDHASRDAVAQDIGKEQDVISGFALVAALTVFLASGPAPPHLLRQLAEDSAGRLLALLLRTDEDVDEVASRKSSNMSRASRSSVHAVKGILQRLPIWHSYDEPVDLSPRTVALQLLAQLSSYADASLLDRILADMETDLVAVATRAADDGSAEDVDYALTVFTLETQSSAGVASRLNSDGAHPSRIAKLLRRALGRWPSGRAKLDSAVLKLAINTTNTETEAAAFDDAKLSTMLTSRVDDGFAKVHSAIGSGRLESEIYDELLLMLGVMINIMEHCPPARRSVEEGSVDCLVKLWQGNLETASEVRRRVC